MAVPFVGSGERPWWHYDAACQAVDREVFFRDGARSDEAKAVCAVCTVVEPCLEWALQMPERDGVWGGLDPEERRRLAKYRRRLNASEQAS